MKISLKSKMSAAVTLLVAGLLGITAAAALVYFEREFKAAISRQQFTLVSALAEEVDGKIRTARDHLVTMAGQVEPAVAAEPQRAQHLFDNMRDDQALFDNGIFLFSPARELVAAVHTEPYRFADDSPLAVWIDRTAATGRPQVSEPFFSPQPTPRPVVLFTSPVFDAAGVVVAVMAGSIDLLNDNFLGKLATVRLGEGGYLYLYNQERTLIVHPDRGRILQQDVPVGANRLFDQALGGFEGSGETVTSWGLHALSSFKRLATTGWILSANYPAEEAFAPIRRARGYFLSGLAALLLAAALFVRTLMHYLTAPLLTLIAQVRTLGDGEEPTSLNIHSRDEIDDLAAAFDLMAHKVAGQRRALEDQKRFSENLLQNAAAPCFVLDATHRVIAWNRACEELTGVPAEEVLGTDGQWRAFYPEPRPCLADLAMAGDGKDLSNYYENWSRSELMPEGLQAEGWLNFKGRDCYVTFNAAPVRNARGEVVAAIETLEDITGRKRAEEKLERNVALLNATLGQLRQLSQAVEQSPNTVMVTDRQGSIEYVNRRFSETTGYAGKEAIGRNPRFLQAGDTPREYFRTLWETIAGGREWRGELHNRKKNGELFWEHALISPLKGPDGAITHFVAVKEDITARKLAERQQQLTAQVLSLLTLAGSSTDKIGDILRLIQDFTGFEAVGIRLRENGGFPYCRAVGFSEAFLAAENHLCRGVDQCPEEGVCLCGRVIAGQADPAAPWFTAGGSFWQNDLGGPPPKAGGGGAGYCIRNRCREEGYRTLAIIPLRSAGEIIGLLQLADRAAGKLSRAEVIFLEGLAGSIGIAFERRQTEEKLLEKEDRLEFLAHYDPLTRLPNRTLLQDRLHHAMAKAGRSGGKVAFLLLDLDRFKTVNDTLGHACGDLLLGRVAEALRETVREGDTLARFGGDEFAVVLEEVDDARNAALVAQKLLQRVSRKVELEGNVLFPTASVGISLFPADADSPESLLKYSELAMYRAKDEGRNGFRFYHPEMNPSGRELLLQSHLFQALELEQFVVYYQPQVDLVSGRLVGFEALLRWRHPELGLVPPGDFIPLAEETGQIVPIGEWVLRTACLQARHWLESGLPPFRMAVNLSARQFRQEDLARMVDRVLAETGLPPEYLELEITESVVMDEVDQAIRVLTDLKARGIHLAIDDFGTGYSSLSYLKRLPITRLKIDRSFVREVTTDPNDAVITASIIALAWAMNLGVVAEGIETEAQQHFLRDQGCGQGQGYLFSRPLPAAELSELAWRLAGEAGAAQNLAS